MHPTRPRSHRASIKALAVALVLALGLVASAASTAQAEERFGKTTVGAIADNGIFANEKVVHAATLSASGSVTKLSVYAIPGVSSPSPQALKAVIYSDSGGSPGALLATGTEVVYQGSVNGSNWFDLPFGSPVALSPGTYWIGFITGESSEGFGYVYDEVEDSRAYNENLYASDPTNPFGPATKDSEQASIYASYVPASTLNPGTTVCDDVYVGSGKDVVVPSGAICTLLAGTRVGHDVRVKRGGTLIDQGAMIGHDLSGDHPRGIAAAGGSVGHDLKIDGLTGAPPSGDNYLCSLSVAHDLSVRNGAAGAGLLDVGDPPDCSAGNSVGHDLVVQNNDGPVDVSENGTLASPIGHDQKVQDNKPGGATVSGNYSGHDATCKHNSPQAGSGNHASHNNSCPT
jgi:hypothetical protein